MDRADFSSRFESFTLQVGAGGGSLMGLDVMTQLTVRAAAERLGIAYSTLKRWILSGRVRTTRTDGGHHRVAESEVDRLLVRRTPSVPARGPGTSAEEALGALSARNRLYGYVEEVRVDGLLAQIRLRVGDQSLTAVITADAVRALGLRRGDDAVAIVKSTEVMIGTRLAEAGRVRRRTTRATR